MTPPADPPPADARALAYSVMHATEGYPCGCAGCTLARALLAALDEREAMLADLPHAVGRCGCRPHTQWASDVLNGATRTWSYQTWPEAHTAAIERLEARIK